MHKLKLKVLQGSTVALFCDCKQLSTIVYTSVFLHVFTNISSFMTTADQRGHLAAQSSLQKMLAVSANQRHVQRWHLHQT